MQLRSIQLAVLQESPPCHGEGEKREHAAPFCCKKPAARQKKTQKGANATENSADPSPTLLRPFSDPSPTLLRPFPDPSPTFLQTRFDRFSPKRDPSPTLLRTRFDRFSPKRPKGARNHVFGWNALFLSRKHAELPKKHCLWAKARLNRRVRLSPRRARLAKAWRRNFRDANRPAAGFGGFGGPCFQGCKVRASKLDELAGTSPFDQLAC